MKKFGTSLYVLLVVAAIPALAQTVDDPLHGCIIGTSCLDNGTVTPTTVNPLPNFTFTVSPPSSPNNPGDLLVEILVPNNEDLTPASLSFTINGTLAGTTDTGTVSGTSTLKGDWTSGALQTFLGLTLGPSSPNNPLNAWLGYTQGNHCGNAQNQACDAGATGYEVYQVDLGANLLQAPGAGVAPVLTLSGSNLPLASVLTGFLGSGSTFANSSNFVSTAPSGGIFEADGPSPVPEPTSVLLLGSVILGLAGVMKKRSQARA